MLADSGPSQSPPSNRHRRYFQARRTANPVAFWSLAFSILWIAGVGSLLGLVLGVTCVKKSKVAASRREGVGMAYAGVVVGIVGVVLAAMLWTDVAGVNAVTSSPSYIDGSSFAMTQYPNATSEASLCVASNAHSPDIPSLWLQGCRDGWYIAAHSFGYPGMPGLNVG